MSATSEELSSQAEMLRDTMGFFRISDHGNGSGQTAGYRENVSKTVRTAPATTTRANVAHLKTYEEVETDPGNGDGKPGGVTFQIGQNGNAGDERDAEFERY